MEPQFNEVAICRKREEQSLQNKEALVIQQHRDPSLWSSQIHGFSPAAKRSAEVIINWFSVNN